MKHADLSPLLDVMDRLLAEGGCPWDRAQNHESLRKHMIEEAYEVCEAIDRKDRENLKEELGDVLYQVVFHAALAEREGAFDLQDVVDAVAEKMKRRHPAIYAPEDAKSSDWESIKLEEKRMRGASVDLPEALPDLLAIAKLSAKLKNAGIEQAALLDCCEGAQARALLTLVMESEQAGDPLTLHAQRLRKNLSQALEMRQK